MLCQSKMFNTTSYVLKCWLSIYPIYTFIGEPRKSFVRFCKIQQWA